MAAGRAVTSLDGPITTWPTESSASAARPPAPVRSVCPVESVLCSAIDRDAIDARPFSWTTVQDGVADAEGLSHTGATASASVAAAASGRITNDAGPRRRDTSGRSRDGAGGMFCNGAGGRCWPSGASSRSSATMSGSAGSERSNK